MIKNLLDKQSIVVRSLKLSLYENLSQNARGRRAEEHIARAEKHLNSVHSLVNETKNEAEETYRSVRTQQEQVWMQC
jgi:outer membrane protein TolC